MSRAASLVAFAFVAACSDDPSGAADAAGAQPSDAGTDAPDAAQDAPKDAADEKPPACAAGSTASVDGTCMPVGIQGCAAMFVGADGLCHPKAAACAKGTIPELATGCVPVGVAGCAPMFVGDDGSCVVTPASCPAGTIALPQEGCVSIDGPDGCGTGTWGNVPDTPGALYVDAAAAPGGDGTKGKPFPTIAAALAKAKTGGTVVVAAGTYPEPIEPSGPVTVRGRCASMVKITGSTDSSVGKTTVYVGGYYQVTLQGLELDGAALAAVLVSAKGAHLGWLHVRGGDSGGVFVHGDTSTVSIDHCLIEPLAKGGAKMGRGIDVESGASATVTSTRVTGTSDVGVFADGAGSSVTMSGSTIDGMVPSMGAGSSGFAAQAQASLAIEGSVIVANQGSASSVDGASLDIAKSTLEPLFVATGAKAKIASSSLAKALDTGIVVTGSGSALELSGSLVTGTFDDGTMGLGLDVSQGAAATVTDCAFVGNAGTAVFVDAKGTEAALSRTLIEGTIESSIGGASGLVAGDGAHVVVDGCAFVDNVSHGMLFVGSAAEASASLIEGTLSQSDASAGYGVAVLSGSNVSLSASALVGNHTAGATIAEATASATDTLVEGTLVQASDGTLGCAFQVYRSSLALSSSVLRKNATMAVIVHGAPSSATIDRTWIDGVAAGSAIATDGTFQAFGDGVDVVYGSTATITASRVTGCARVGILYFGSGGSISGTTSMGNAFGLVLESTPTPMLGDGNVITGNTTNTLSDGNLPVPSDMIPVPKM